MNELKIVYTQKVLGNVFSIYGDVDNPLFLAKDVAEWIEHSATHMMLKTVDDDEKLTETLFLSGQKREAWFLTEDGLYEVLMQSRKPIAKQFKRKVKEILKSVRRTGAYMTENTLEQAINNPDFTIGLLTKLKEEQERAKLLEYEKHLKEMLIQEQTPKVESYDRYIDSEGTYCIRDVGKILGYGQKEFFALLRENEILYKHRNVPKQQFVDSGYFELKTGSGVHSEKTYIQSRITTKGLDWLSKKFNKTA
ncbi:antirepressor [Bacillus phage Stills]|uniref:Antirepressor n=1 Tax=Bacillus phage Stills TaxID=1610833 RepID=A0A0E3T6E1_9CAUD|nr:anti-repressor Ant [Bacillus phage Stills]AKC02729.1 antirepressor [Bacillus phage Stills]